MWEKKGTLIWSNSSVWKCLEGVEQEKVNSLRPAHHHSPLPGGTKLIYYVPLPPPPPTYTALCKEQFRNQQRYESALDRPPAHKYLILAASREQARASTLAQSEVGYQQFTAATIRSDSEK